MNYVENSTGFSFDSRNERRRRWEKLISLETMPSEYRRVKNNSKYWRISGLARRTFVETRRRSALSNRFDSRERKQIFFCETSRRDKKQKRENGAKKRKSFFQRWKNRISSVETNFVTRWKFAARSSSISSRSDKVRASKDEICQVSRIFNVRKIRRTIFATIVRRTDFLRRVFSKFIVSTKTFGAVFE